MADRGRGGKTTSGNGQAWSSASPRGQWRTGGNGENWLQDHLWCPNDPRGYGIDDDDDAMATCCRYWQSWETCLCDRLPWRHVVDESLWAELHMVGMFRFIIIIIVNPLTARAVGAPQMILQPVFSIFPCSPLPSGTCRTPGLSIP